MPTICCIDSGFMESHTDIKSSIKEIKKVLVLSIIIPEVEGTAYITGMNTFIIDPKDPMKKGFILR